MRLSARNMLKGRVKQVTPGAVNNEIVIELEGGTEVVSVIPRRRLRAWAWLQARRSMPSSKHPTSWWRLTDSGNTQIA